MKANNVSVRRPAANAARRRGLLENLESRKLMAGYAANFNFQPAVANTPAGMTADYGRKFGWQFGKQYGWSSDHTGNTVERKTTASDELDSYVKIGSTPGYSKWEAAVPNGTYTVKVIAGDANAYDSKYVLTVEGTTVINETPTSTKRWVEGTKTVNVTDGKLTLTSGSGASNSKVTSIRITQGSGTTVDGSSAAPAAPTGVTATATSSTSVLLKWSDKSSNESGFQILRSTDNVNFSQIATVGAGSTSYNNGGLTAGKKYFYQVRAYNNFGSKSSTSATVITPGATGGGTPGGDTLTAPDAPTGVSAVTTGTTSIKVSWTDNADNEDGYTVYRSTDGSNFTAVAWIGAGSTSYSNTGLTAGTKYYYQVRAYNDAGTRSSGTVNATTSSPAPTPTPTPTPTPGTDGITNRFAMSGIVQNELPFHIADPAMDALGIKSVRLWYEIGSWTGSLNTNDISRALQYKNAGYSVTLAVVSKSVTDPATAKSYFQKLMANGTARAAVDFWEIGNEPNHTSYWNSSLQKYVTNYLKPAYEAIKPYGEMVIGGGVSYDVNAAAQLQSYGYSNYCDYVGFHPYGESGAIVAQRAAAAKAAFGGKQMIITEWNVQRVTDLTKWAREITIAAQSLQHIAYINYYYALKYDATHVGKGGLVFSDGRRNTQFWNEIYNWTH